MAVRPWVPSTLVTRNAGAALPGGAAMARSRAIVPATARRRMTSARYRLPVRRNLRATLSRNLVGMKYLVLVPDGCADEPLAELDGRTPLEAARMPHLARLAAA